MDNDMSNKLEIPEHLQRVIIEKKELLTKLDSLIAFLNKGQPDCIDDKQWRLLDDQYKHMKAYHTVLCERVADAIDKL